MASLRFALLGLCALVTISGYGQFTVHAAAPPVDAPLPTDVPTLHAMVRDLLAELARLRAENAELKTKLDAALKHRFGRRSERRTPPPMPAADKPPPRRDDQPGRLTLDVYYGILRIILFFVGRL